MVAEIKVDRDGVKEDFQFHQAIAVATNNIAYQNFLAFLARNIHAQLVVTSANTKSAGLIGEIETEHCRIYDAIKAGRSDAARDASRQHLENGMLRLINAEKNLGK